MKHGSAAIIRTRACPGLPIGTHRASFIKCGPHARSTDCVVSTCFQIDKYCGSIVHRRCPFLNSDPEALPRILSRRSQSSRRSVAEWRLSTLSPSLDPSWPESPAHWRHWRKSRPCQQRYERVHFSRVHESRIDIAVPQPALSTASNDRAPILKDLPTMFCSLSRRYRPNSTFRTPCNERLG